MSGLFRRLSSRRSDGPEDPTPRPADEAGTADAATTTPAEPGGHQSLLSDPAAPTRVLPQSHAVDPSAAAPVQPGDPRAAAFPAPARPEEPSADPGSAHPDAPSAHAPTADPAPAHPDARPTYAAPDPAGAPSAPAVAHPEAPAAYPAPAAAPDPAGAPSAPAAAHPEAPAAYPAPAAGAYAAPVVPPAYGTPGRGDLYADALTPAHPSAAYGTEQAQALPAADLPAGLDPDELADAPSPSARRGKLRRRIAFLRAARELLLRDLGGFVYELHRTAHDIEADAHRHLRETKIERLSRVDAELHTLEMRLDDVRRQVLVREPGIGGECPNCTELYASAAHYCSNCGLPLSEGARRAEAERAAADVEPALPVVPDPEPHATSPADQPTEELSPLDPEHPGAGTAEFRWPRRTGPGDEPAASLDEPRVAESADAPEAGAKAASGEAAETDAAEADEPVAPMGDSESPDTDIAAVEPTGEAASAADAEPDVTPAPAEPATAESGQDDAAPTAEPDKAAADGDAAPGEDSSASEENRPGSRDWAARDDDSYVDPVERRP